MAPISGASLSMSVDLRPIINSLNISVRQQTFNNCAVYGITFLLEYMYRTRMLTDLSDLSEEYLRYATYVLANPQVPGGDNFGRLNIGYQLYGICDERLVPESSFPVASINNNIINEGQAMIRLTPQVIKQWNNMTGVNNTQLNKIILNLHQNIPVAVGLRWPNSLSITTIRGVDIIDTPSPAGVFDGHVVCIVGYRKHSDFPGGGYFIIRNCWGTTFQDSGYGYLSFHYLKNYANDLIAYKFSGISYAPLKKAAWVHGCISKVEYPNQIKRIDNKGWGKTFIGKARTFNWFHIPLTTPVVYNGVRPRCTKIFIFYKTGNHPSITPVITNFHVWDGNKRIKSFDGLSLYGDYSSKIVNPHFWHAGNSWYMNPIREIYYGLGISIGVSFPDGSDDKRSFHIATAGADFT